MAHIDSYDHLREIVKIKKPGMLHVADKHFSATHEHLPIGHGDLDYAFIFKDILHDFNGKIIFEVVAEDKEIIDSKNAIKSILM